MIYVSVTCPTCGQENEVDETLNRFFCLKCGTECDLEFESIYEPEKDAPPTPKTTSGEEAEKRLKRAFLFVEDGDWGRAWSYCESVLDYDPENAEAYLAELLVSFRLRSRDNLRTCKDEYRSHPLFKKAMRFADDDLRSWLDAAQSYEGNLAKYERARKYMENAGKPGGSVVTKRYLLDDAAKTFESLGSFEDSEELASECRELLKRC